MTHSSKGEWAWTAGDDFVRAFVSFFYYRPFAFRYELCWKIQIHFGMIARIDVSLCICRTVLVRDSYFGYFNCYGYIRWSMVVLLLF